ncbi:GGDEF domain-containing protein [Chitinimonas arctica]|uniref:diguanylate cyclase n=1 Tax=Chitinimonas arctica TaxID=2594795 RepID=A0A516SLL1_9NEIS|nr:GGDEF domain-containing protein [Chitinimonas arctica]QDQ29042.1 GGDEF domain-containing protein [Chitinimonas arctica]
MYPMLRSGIVPDGVRQDMLHINPELLSNSSQSAYGRAFEQGYRGLRFEGALEQEFQRFYLSTHLVRLRWAGFLAITLFGLFVLVDVFTLPLYVSQWTASIRLGLIIPAFGVGLWISYRSEWHHHLQLSVFIAALITGLGTVGVIAVALAQNYPIPYEGILLVALFIYFIACLQWWRALLANLVTVLAFVIMEALCQTDPSQRLYQIIFMFTANAVGATGSYFLEYSTRTTFLVHALLNELAERDGLTGLYNRRTLNNHLDKVWRQAIRDGRQLALAMIDVDYFKRYNDHYGHAEGDRVLRQVADVIAGQARRPLDLAARYGGEEFALVWYQPTASELAPMGEQLREAIADLCLPHAGSETGRLSVSIGIALLRPSGEQHAETLLRAADTALYEAKQAGRDRVVVVGTI